MIAGFYGVAHEHGDGHGTDSSGNGCDLGGFGSDIIVVYITNEAEAAFAGGVFDSVNAYVNDDGSRFDHVFGDESGFSNRGDEDVGLTGDFLEIGSAGVAIGDGGIAERMPTQQEQAGGFADDEAASQHDNVLAAGFHITVFEEFDNACWGAGVKGFRVFLHEFSGVDYVEAVDVFGGVHVVEDGIAIYV